MSQKPRWVLESATISGFKSFSRQPAQTLHFAPGFNAIAGANGSGKSNAFDAVLFALGVPREQLRAARTDDLRSSDGATQSGAKRRGKQVPGTRLKSQQPSTTDDQRVEATVVLAVPGTSSRCIIKNVLDGTTRTSSINGRSVTQRALRSFLHSEVGISTRPPSFLIQQGAVARILSAKNVIADLLCEASGVKAYNETRALAVLQLQRVTRLELEISRNIAEMERALAADVSVMQSNQKTQRVQAQLAAARERFIRLKYAEVREKIADAQIIATKQREELAALKVSERETTEALNQAEEALRQATTDEAHADLKRQEAVSVQEIHQERVRALRSEASENEQAADGAAHKRSELEYRLEEVYENEDGASYAKASAESKVAGLDKHVRALTSALNDIRGADSNGAKYCSTMLQKHMERVRSQLESYRVQRDAAARRVAMVEANLIAAKQCAGTAESQLAFHEAKLLERQENLKVLQETFATRFTSNKDGLSARIAAIRECCHSLRIEIQSTDSRMAEARSEALRSAATVSALSGVRGRLFDLVNVRDGFEKYRPALDALLGAKLGIVVATSVKNCPEILSCFRRAGEEGRVWPLDSRISATDDAVHVTSKLLANVPLQYHAELHDPIDALDCMGAAIELLIRKALGKTLLADSVGAAVAAIQAGLSTATLDGCVHRPGLLLGGQPSRSRSAFGCKIAHQNLMAKRDCLQRRLEKEREHLEEEEQRLLSFSQAARELSEAQAAVELLKCNMTEEIESVRAARDTVQALEEEEKSTRLQVVPRLEQCCRCSEATLHSLHAMIVASDEGDVAETLMSGERELVLARDYRKTAANELSHALEQLEEAETVRLDAFECKADLDAQITQRSSAMVMMMLRAAQKDLTVATATVQAAEEEYQSACATTSQLKQTAKRLSESRGKLLVQLSHTIHEDSQQEELSALRRSLQSLLSQHPWVEHTDVTIPSGSNAQELVGQCELEISKLEGICEAIADNSDRNFGYSRAPNEAALKGRQLELDRIKERMETLERARLQTEGIIASSVARMRRANDITFDRVRKEFSRLFGYLVPGKRGDLLRRDHAAAVEEGLRFAIQNGSGPWKTDLSELSGGQQALLALAYIFSLASVTRSPFFMFDEVDAALDEHNQQIVADAMLRAFDGAQLIAVSHHQVFQQCATHTVVLEMSKEGTRVRDEKS